METKRFEGEVEPYCKWQYGEKCDILVAHLHGFVENDVKIEPKRSQDRMILTLTGERPLDGTRTTWKKLRKEVEISKYKANAINCKFEGGIVRITMRKKSSWAAKFDLLRSNIIVKIIIWFALGVIIGVCGRCYIKRIY
ncbi:hypothetical protein I3760_09G162700 [Carya illinoinensis]|uniref:SHSP domain-containing protein n=1 Tax=Carya illinoinensis TaxID=32201 RepID=A0A8T1PNH1_CARIL|nr:uncharacterized protein LOC122277253 [Carya illinoinensis]KAG2689919.1 hypothetical protein I3760_09G162700 [Carya illinoinensis]KAG6642787.1 hypothetical protein CIPAW_09G165100 [Carya illinoinensis]KAG6696767.1 hypothetical protein I3842_09G165600 [Carya illinoinensis]